MRKQTFQHAEIRDENDNIISAGAYGKNTALSNKQNDGWVDYVMNNLERLYEKGKTDASTMTKELAKKAEKADVYTKPESDGRYQAKGDYVTTGVANETYLGKNALEEIKNRLDTIENIARTPTGSLVTYDLQDGLLGTIPERIQVIKVSCIESPNDFVFCGMRTSDRELSFSLEQTNSGVCLKLSNKNTQIETVTAVVNIMPHFKIEWSYEINRQKPTKFFN